MIKSVKTNTTVDSFNQRILEAERQHWFSVIQRIIFLIKYLSRQSLAFRGILMFCMNIITEIFLMLLKLLRVLML